MTLTHFAIIAVCAYLLGSLSFAIIVSKLTLGKDIRNYGSGNAGLTNAYRTMGAKKTLLVLLGDIAKGAAAVSIGMVLAGPVGKLTAGIFVILGHMFPLYFGFKGGKGILCSGTLLLLLDWRIAAVGWGLFALLWLTTRYVSLGSVSGAVSFPVTTLIFCPGNWTVFVLSLLIAALVIWAHRENISRLLHGTESRFRWHTDAP